MAKLPYHKTTIRDMSKFINLGDGSSGLNIATIINAKTGPMDRVTLTSFDDLVNYYCTGTQITQLDDTTVQCIGALLNSSAVDVIRVGSAKLFVGKTNDNKIIYTDSNYNLIDKLTRISFKNNVTREQSLAIGTDDYIYYVGSQPTRSLSATFYQDSQENEYKLSVLTKRVSELLDNDISVLNYTDDTIQYENLFNFYDTYLTDTTITYYQADTKITTVADSKIDEGEGIKIGNTTYIYNGDIGANSTNIYLEPCVKFNWCSKWNNNELDEGNSEKMPSDKFLAMIIANMNKTDIVSYKVNYDFSSLIGYSDNLNNRITNKVYSYSKDIKYDKLWFATESTIYVYNGCEYPEEYDALDDTDTRIYEKIELTERETDFSSIINLFEVYTDTEIIPVIHGATLYTINLETVCTFDSDNAVVSDTHTVFIRDFNAQGIYSVTFKPQEFLTDNYSLYVDGYVYYCGKTPTEYTDVIEYTCLSESDLKYDEFIDKLTRQLLADMAVGLPNLTTVVFQGTPNIQSTNKLRVFKTPINQSELVKNSKFALVAKFPTSQKMFSYSYIRNTSIEKYDVIDLTWIYNQISKTVSISFDENACDDFGTLLYYTKYNEGDYANDYVHILQFNNFVKFDENDDEAKENAVNVGAFGNELIMPDPTATDYASALLKFKDYEDKQYSFIWDAGYCSPILAKAMNQLALEKNAQFVPSFPSSYKTYDQVKAYHESLGLNTFQAIEVVPGFKGTYCGSFLTAVPGGLAYIVARVNSYSNGSTEFQPLFGPRRGAVSAPNLQWYINKTDQQKLADMNINSIVSDINGVYINNNVTSQKITSYLSEDQNVYMSNVIAHVCEEYNPKIIAELNDAELWGTVVNQLTQLLSARLQAGKKPTLNAFRVICDEKLNTQDVIEANQLKYKVEVQYTPSVKFITAYLDVVRLNSF